MNHHTTRRVHHTTAFITFVAIVFCLFFQINKIGPFRDINPFGEDPYDAVGSFATQGALLIGILTYARALRLCDDPTQATKMRLILRGNILVLCTMLVTLLTDALAVLLNPLPPSFWSNVLLIELVLMFLLVLCGIITLITVFKSIQPGPSPRDLTPADGIDDLWTLARVPVTKIEAFLPPAFVAWVRRFDSDRAFAHVRWLHPRTHPWRFACALGLLVGLGLTLAQLQEGLPPSLAIGLLVAAIFVGAELIATLVGFALLGGYLGLRPAFRLPSPSV